jgi:hypothetical protein
MDTNEKTWETKKVFGLAITESQLVWRCNYIQENNINIDNPDLFDKWISVEHYNLYCQRKTKNLSEEKKFAKINNVLADYSVIMDMVAFEFSEYMWYEYTKSEIPDARIAPSYFSKDVICFWDDHWGVTDMILVLSKKIPSDKAKEWHYYTTDMYLENKKPINLLTYIKKWQDY